MNQRRTITVGGASRDGLTSLGVSATLRRLSMHQWMLRVLVVVGPLLTLSATMAARGAFQPIALLVIGTMAVGCALAPDSHLGLLVVLLASLNWLQTVNDETTPWLLPATGGLLVLHTAMAAATIAPPAASWPHDLVFRWARRVGVVMVATVVAWLVALGVAEVSLDGHALVLIIAMLSVAGLIWWARSRSLG